jgi:hypothetical protein
MTSVTKSYGVDKSNTSFYINEDIASSYDLYDEKGGFTTKGFSLDQDGSKVTITGDESSNYTLLDCNASSSGWLKSDRQYAYSDTTYSDYDTVRIDFKNADPTLPFEDMIIGFAGADNLSSKTVTYRFFNDLGAKDNFYFFLRPESDNTKTYTIIYNGSGKVSRYIDGVLQDTTAITFGTWFPGGLKIFAVFNNGYQGTNYHYKVKLYQPKTIYPARTLLCKNMGKNYILNDETYIKVQNVTTKTNFYINTSETVFASLNY